MTRRVTAGRRDPYRPATPVDIVRAVFHALIAALFTMPMWIIAVQLRHWPEQLRVLPWLIGGSNLLVWGLPVGIVIERWRQLIYRHPERATSSLVRTFAVAQGVAILLALPLLLWFGKAYLAWLYF